MMDLGLAGRRIAITGASAGIGRAIALTLAEEGARLVLGARGEKALRHTARELSSRGMQPGVVVGDLTSPEGAAALVARAQQCYGGLDGLVCCVGSTPLGTFDALDDEMWLSAYETKFLGTVRAVRAALPALQASGHGRVVVLAGNSTFDPEPTMATSAVVNAALGALVSTLARSYGAEGVRFVCVDPGPTDTARFQALRKSMAHSHGTDESTAEKLIRARIPTGHITTPEEVAITVALSLSPKQPQLTGTRIVVDGAATWVR